MIITIGTLTRPTHQRELNPGGSSGREDDMDVDIMGRILGMPFDLIGRMSDPPFWNSAILAAALSAGLVSIANLVLDRRRTGKEKTRRQLQVITQLKGRKMEIKDLYMTLMQTTLNQVFTNVIRTNFTPNRNDEARVLNQENFRLRQLGDNLIVEVSKSTGRLIETLSAVQYLFPNVIEIDKKINNIIQMQQSLVHEFERKLLNQFNEDIISEMGTLAQKGGVSGVTSEQINRLQNALVDGASDEIFK